MKRFHVHVAVEDLDRSIAFYAGLFGAPPTVRKDDYAKWMVEDPRLNFAISQRGGTPGLNHLGLQADSVDELAAIRSAFTAADASAVVAQPDAMCCYVRSDKHWLTDPQGIAWEGYHSLEAVEFFDGTGGRPERAVPAGGMSGCCAPATATDDGAGTSCTTDDDEAAPAAAHCCAPGTGEEAGRSGAAATAGATSGMSDPLIAPPRRQGGGCCAR